MNEKLKQVSKFLSYILRHHPESIGLTLDNNGWADLDELVNLSLKDGRKITKELVFETVTQNDKKRFALNDDNTKIRAVQGHSLEVDLELEEQIPPEKLFHGTATRFLDSILEKGLIPSGRQYVHLSSDLETAVNVGKRHGKPVVLEIKAGLMLDEGYKFYLSQNKVWLTNNVPEKYIDVIKTRD